MKPSFTKDLVVGQDCPFTDVKRGLMRGFLDCFKKVLCVGLSIAFFGTTAGGFSNILSLRPRARREKRKVGMEDRNWKKRSISRFVLPSCNGRERRSRLGKGMCENGESLLYTFQGGTYHIETGVAKNNVEDKDMDEKSIKPVTAMITAVVALSIVAASAVLIIKHKKREEVK